jgi:hypothetical protein
MVGLDRDHLERLRQEAQEVREDLAEREAAAAASDHDAVMASTREVLKKFDTTQLVRKVNAEARVLSRADDPVDDAPPFDDAQIDGLADMMVQVGDMIADATGDLRDRVAALEGKMDMLASLLGNGKTSKIIRPE